MSSACPTRDDWSGLLADECSIADRERMAEHLETCADCRRLLEQLAGELAIPAGVHTMTADQEPAAATRDDPLRAVISRLLAEGARSRDPEVPRESDLPPGLLSPSSVPGALGRIGKYEVLSIIGRGGLGIVMKGLDPQLNRIVALKIPAPELTANAAVRKRFFREAQAAAAVSHDHVVTIHSVEESNGIPYLVMEYINGTSLQQVIDEQGPLELRQILRIGMQTAAGLAAAHKQGIVHRDVKPANILLENGVQRVKLTDFGLARAVDDASITQSGVVAGTPQYMSPEQGRGDSIDARSDLFSLGAVLYAMCTGRPAFRADSTMAVIKRVCEDDPRPIEQINPEIPVWLIAIIERLMAKQPSQRIQTARDVSDRLGGHLAHLQEPSVAHPPAPLPRKPRKRPASLARKLTNLVIVLVLLVLAIGWLRTDTINHFPATIQSEQARPFPPQQGSDQNALRRAVTIEPPANSIHGADFSPSDNLFVAGASTTAYLWDAKTAALSAWDSNNAGQVRCVRYSPDGQWLAVAGQGGIPYIHDAHNLSSLRARLEGLGQDVTCLAWSPNGERVAAATTTVNQGAPRAPAVAVWNAADGKMLWKRDLPFDKDHLAATGVTFSSDGSRVVVSYLGRGNVISVFDAGAGRFMHSFGGPRHGDDPLCLAQIPGRDLILTGHAAVNRTANSLDDPEHAVINLWNIDNGELLKTFRGHRGCVTSLDVSRDGLYLLSGSGGRVQQGWEFPAIENELRMWTIATAELLFVEQVPNSIREVRFSHDGRQVASIDGGNGPMPTMQLWEIDPRFWPADSSAPAGPTQPIETSFPFEQEIYSARFSPNGQEILVGLWGGAGLVRLQISTAEKRTGPDDRIAARYPFVTRAIYLPDRRIAATSEAGVFDIYDLRKTPAVQPFRAGKNMIWQVSSSADGKLLAAGGDDGQATVWHVDGGLRQKLDHPKIIRSVAISPDGVRVATAGDDRTTRIWNVADGQQTRQFGDVEISDLVFLADSRRLAAAGSDYQVHLWDAETGDRLRRFQGHTDVVVCVAVSKDQRLLASGSLDHTVRIWNLETGEELSRHLGHSGKVTSVDFSPDGRWLVSSGDRTVRLWPVPELATAVSGETPLPEPVPVPAEPPQPPTATSP